jgi:hypothetical protein
LEVRVQSAVQPIESQPTMGAFTATEVRRLWWFLDGAIMHADTRVALRRSWGLCPHHAWGMAAVECELRGGALLATSVLYADLMAGAAALLGGHHFGSRTRRLQPREACPTCAHSSGEHAEPQEWLERAERVNRHSRFLPMVRASWEEARPRSCGPCAGGSGPTCRLHLLDGADDAGDLAKCLAQLAVRIHAYEKSLTVDGRPVGRRGRAAWLETLGWFAGWEFPAALAAAER